MNRRKIFWGVFGLAVFSAVWPLLAPRHQQRFPIEKFAQLPILEGGRLKPMDSFARNSLLEIRGTQDFLTDSRTLSASEWLLDALFHPEVADTYAIFTIDDPDVLGLLRLEPGKTRRFAYWQIDSKGAEEVRSQAERAAAVDAGKRSRFQNAVVNFASRIDLYQQIKNTIAIPNGGDPEADLAMFARTAGPAMAAMHHQGSTTRLDRAALKTFAELLERYRFLAGAAAFRPIPPLPGQPADAWSSLGEAVLRPVAAAAAHPALLAYVRMARSYHNDDATGFSEALNDYSSWLEREQPAAARQARQEFLFNRAQPFLSGMALYIAALLGIFAWWATRRPDVRAVAMGLLAAAFVVHTAGLAARIILQGRPPVTNLYSSAIFVGWVAAGLGLAAERSHKKGFAAAGGALLGFCTLLIAHHLSGSGDTMEMMRAVLDSNFWLATHVVTVTMGYGSTFLAGALGIAWVLRRQFLAKPDPETTKALVSLAYGVVAFSLFFSFVGTVLGGIWADQSWGRFWGWDPKENGALLIVLWNATILHARFSGLARERGIMVMTVVGNIVTSLSWFGVNMLGIGLHSYGFMEKAFWWLLAFGISQLLLIVLGLLPPRFWAEPPVRPA